MLVKGVDRWTWSHQMAILALIGAAIQRSGNKKEQKEDECVD
jgi:hypothetical protein